MLAYRALAENGFTVLRVNFRGVRVYDAQGQLMIMAMVAAVSLQMLQPH
jgi:hypothetical protein